MGLSRRKATLILEDGTLFVGKGFGGAKKTSGEVVFSTSMMGYPEALTDPSYRGQILTLTYPIVGNYGVPSYGKEKISPYFESEGIKVEGLVIHDLCEKPSHWQSERTLDQWLKDEGIPGIYGIDTRRLTKALRVKGVMRGIIESCSEGEEPDVDATQVKSVPDIGCRDLVGEVSVKEPIIYEGGGKGTVVVIDCGVKYGILREVVERAAKVIRVPHDTAASEILEYEPTGVLISNGPGDPKKCIQTIKYVRELLEADVALMGICLGNQILALSAGGDTYKLKFGHRSQNQPVLDLDTRRCYITTQNHGYAIDIENFKCCKDWRTWFTNANDGTIEGIIHTKKRIFAVQWHPEASPGPYDTQFLFNRFMQNAGMIGHV